MRGYFSGVGQILSELCINTISHLGGKNKLRSVLSPFFKIWVKGIFNHQIKTVLHGRVSVCMCVNFNASECDN